MPRRDTSSFTTGHLCRFCGELVPWGAILRLIRVDPDTPGFMLSESACHTDCLKKLLRPGVELTFHRHWTGRAPLLDDSADVDGHPARCAGRTRSPKCWSACAFRSPSGRSSSRKFDEQTLPLHFGCLAGVSCSRFG